MKVNNWLIFTTLAFCFQLVTASESVHWELENYNNWNMPFAKTVEIKGRSTSGSLHPYTLAANSYKLEVDPSALFTILFLDPDLVEYNKEDLVNLDYNVFGSTSLLGDVQGIWMDVYIGIPQSLRDIHVIGNWYEAEITIFVAFADPADSGLDGTLSICILPETGDWKEVSLMQKLEEKFGFTTIYVNFQFAEVSDLYVGYVTFDKGEPDMLDAMTFGGQIIL